MTNILHLTLGVNKMNEVEFTISSETENTQYHGIYIQRENNEYWITDSLGGDEFCGINKPSQLDVTNYRNLIINQEL